MLFSGTRCKGERQLNDWNGIEYSGQLFDDANIGDAGLLRHRL